MWNVFCSLFAYEKFKLYLFYKRLQNKLYNLY